MEAFFSKKNDMVYHAFQDQKNLHLDCYTLTGITEICREFLPQTNNADEIW